MFRRREEMPSVQLRNCARSVRARSFFLGRSHTTTSLSCGPNRQRNRPSGENAIPQIIFANSVQLHQWADGFQDRYTDALGPRPRRQPFSRLSPAPVRSNGRSDRALRRFAVPSPSPRFERFCRWRTSRVPVFPAETRDRKLSVDGSNAMVVTLIPTSEIDIIIHSSGENRTVGAERQ